MPFVHVGFLLTVKAVQQLRGTPVKDYLPQAHLLQGSDEQQSGNARPASLFLNEPQSDAACQATTLKTTEG